MSLVSGDEPHIPVLKTEEQDGPWGSLATPSRVMCELWAAKTLYERMCELILRITSRVDFVITYNMHLHT